MPIHVGGLLTLLILVSLVNSPEALKLAAVSSLGHDSRVRQIRVIGGLTSESIHDMIDTSYDITFWGDTPYSFATHGGKEWKTSQKS